MPPNLDIYVVSKHRDRETVDRFIETWVNRAKSEDRGDEELMLLPLGASSEPTGLQGWEWELARTLTHIVGRGLDHPRRAFAVYLKPQDPSIDDIMLTFTADDRIVLGVSLDDEGEREETLDRAKRLLHALILDFDADAGFIGCEVAPPLTGRVPPPGPGMLFTWTRATVE